jgi:NAD(P)-dependent dehydrogenase (short-subunit alcohol dehydrogenase family)
MSKAGASVYAIAREHVGLDELKAWDPSIEVAVADATDPNLAGNVIDSQDPDILALIAGASPLLRPIHHHSWETFALNWQVDVRLTFNWLREAVLKPLRPGSRVLLMSSAAATHGSPMSGGYAGAKATIRFLAAYADEEARRNDLGLRVVAVLPGLTPATALGLSTVRNYAEREGVSEERFRAMLGSPVTPEHAGKAFVELAAGELDSAVAYTLTGDDGLTELPAMA